MKIVTSFHCRIDRVSADHGSKRWNWTVSRRDRVVAVYSIQYIVYLMSVRLELVDQLLRLGQQVARHRSRHRDVQSSVLACARWLVLVK